jgi:glutathione-regulated potassium-efflux system ancillary protein KefC
MLGQTAIFLAAAVLAVPLFKRLGLGSVLGYLAAGAVIGPVGLGLVKEVEATLHIAELGVVLLLFVIGLELQPARVWRMRGAVFGSGGIQVVATALPLGLAALLLGASTEVAVVVALGLPLSSTAFAIQVLGEKNELTSSHGRAAFGILLFQDLAAIPMLALVPLLGSAGAQSERSGWMHAAIAVGIIAAVILAGRYLLRPAFRFIALARSHELSTASALLVVIGTSLLMQVAGLSMALGAFLAGVLLADSEYRHELEANIEPFKGLLLGLFFMAVGMSADFRVVADRPGAVIGLVLGLVAVKMAVLYGLGRFKSQAPRSALSLAISISQGGEFAFVLFGLAAASGVMPSRTLQLLIVVVTLSMCVTPLLFLARDALFRRIDARTGETREFDTIEDDDSRVIIAGFGRFGQIVGRILSLKRIRFTALDASPAQVDFVRRFGNRIYYGDPSRVDLLRAARADKAEVFVLAVDDVEASLRTLETVQRNYPHLRVVARARNRPHAYALIGAGVDLVIRETFHGSIEAARKTLEELGMPSADAREVARQFAEYDEEQIRRVAHLRDDLDALILSAKEHTAELERLFDADARS